jgi:hypothetical protein
MQGVLFSHGNSLVRLARWGRAVGSKTRPAVMRKPARAGARAVLKATYRKKTWQEKRSRKDGKTHRNKAHRNKAHGKTHRLAGSTLSNPANDDLRYRRTAWLSTSGSHPRTRSNRRRRSLCNQRNLCKHGSLCNHGNHRTRARRPGRPPAPPLRFPYRKRRTSLD